MRKQLTILALLAILPLGCNGQAVEKDSPPNFIILIGDDMAVETVGCYGVGSAPAKTPRIDQLCDEGMRFDNFWSQAVCSPTRASILTGQYGFRNGVGTPAAGDRANEYRVPEKPANSPPEVGGRDGRIRPDGGGGGGDGSRRGNREIEPNPNAQREGYTEPPNARPSISIDAYGLPAALRADTTLGYETAAFGKWHLSSADNGNLEHTSNIGFEHYSGSYASAVESFFAWSQVIDGSITDGRTGYATTDVVDDAIEWIGARNDDKPWLAWVAFNAPHSPYGAPPDSLLSAETAKTISALDINENAQPFYAAMIEAMDTEIGRLLASMDSDELANTYVIFLGDNGTPSPNATAPFTSERVKGTVYQGGVNVPFVVTGPGIEAGKITQALANSVDLYATILELAGTSANEKLDSVKLDSVSLAPVLADHSVQVRNFAYADAFGPQNNRIENLRAIRDDQFKIVIDLQNNTTELYDLQVDPYETEDLLQETLEEETEVRYYALLAQLEELLASN